MKPAAPPSVDHAKEIKMNFVRTMQQRDWIIAFIAFVLGALIF